MRDFEPSEHVSAPVDEVEAEPVAPAEPEAVAEPPQPEADEESVVDLGSVAMSESEPVIELSYPAIPAPAEAAPSEHAPPGLAVDAFRDIKPVAFGGFAAAEDEPAVEDEAPEPIVDAAPEPAIEVTHEPVVDVAPEPVIDAAPEPVLEVTHEPVVDVAPEPVIEITSEPVVEIASEPVADVAPEPEDAPELEPIELISYPAMESEPVIELDPEPVYMSEPPMGEPEAEFEEPEPVAAMVADDAPAAEPKSKGRLKLPNPQIRLPKVSLSRKPKASGDDSAKSFLNLPENLRGPLNEIERKIALGSVLAVVAAAAFGYMSAPSDEVSTTTPPAAPAAASR